MLLDGKKVRDEILENIRLRIREENIQARLAIILVGDNEASKIYIKNKEAACKKVGIAVDKYVLDQNTSQDEVLQLIEKLNHDTTVTGIILQSPTPKHIDFALCSGTILAKKDVDGFTQENIYNLYLNRKTLMPCTVKGIITLLQYYKIPIAGKRVVIVGRGNIVGHPLSLALTNLDATVTLAHSKTEDLKCLCRDADILIAAAGVPYLITKDMVHDGAVVVDVGVNRCDGNMIGDVDYEHVAEFSSYITPNPGGVGPMSLAMIMQNVIEAYERRNE
ncbi:MAG: bifunctional 5,10-methylenetetrahydrofolate dehydrogenase/5,10-methenyltetrahydrofolate cyclohydrolase [Bacilli bacterium]|nr:bifunctional 5,10-methylenetetrahydrofolate dehydrogenase/5,10-methenyltetrahydrofolate cyclohydrolase [Bacilli bacterium]